MNNSTIRLLAEEDIHQLVQLCVEHAAYEKTKYKYKGKEALLLEHLFLSEQNLIKCLVIEHKKTLIGYVTLLKQFSTWNAGFYLYMDCLFLKEKFRGKGIGKMIMKVVKRYALEENCHLQWQTPEFNKKAIEFYKKLGAENKSKERFYWNFN